MGGMSVESEGLWRRGSYDKNYTIILRTLAKVLYVMCVVFMHTRSFYYVVMNYVKLAIISSNLK
jgi:hypothetical protein